MKVLRSLFLTLFVLGLLGWVYIALIALVHPETLSWPLTHFLPWPREDTFGIMCFGVSGISFLLWNMMRESK